ncbi:riboflavin synthase [Kaarinaea lacus]
MFTGIIQAVGKIASLEPRGGDVRVAVASDKLPLDDVALGDSICVNGVCLTAVEKSERGFKADVSNETLSRTTLADLSQGSRVNLELALTPSTRLGGHFLSGHVDGVGEVVKRWSDGRSERFTIKAPASLAKYIAEKGSIGVDGISLTVNKVSGVDFELNIVPHTLQETTMGDFHAGRKVNLEVDIIARYLERLLLGEKAAETESTLSADFLQQHGFIK